MKKFITKNLEFLYKNNFSLNKKDVQKLAKKETIEILEYLHEKNRLLIT